MRARIREATRAALALAPLGGCFLITEADIRARALDGGSEAPASASVGVVVRLPNDAPVPAATVVAGGVSARTDDGGLATLGVAGGPVVVGAGVPGLTTTAWAAIDAPPGRMAGASLVVHPLTRHLVHRADRGAAVGLVDDHAVVLGPLLDESGAVASGDADVVMRWFRAGEPGVPSGVDWELFAAAYVEGVEGRTASLWPAAPATLRVRTKVGDPVRTASDPRALWFDPEAGAWTDVGFVALEPNHATASFDRPGWWALGAPATMLGCVEGTVAAPGASVTIGAEGVLGSVVVSADASGAVSARIPAGATGEAAVWGFEGGALKTGIVALAAVAATGTTGAGCVQVGEIAVETSVDADDDGFFAGPGGDCDDDAALVRPGAIDDHGDGEDTNCDGADGRDYDRDGFPAGEGPSFDCDDDAPTVSPGAPEVCDELDNDCDGLRDEDVSASVEDPAGSGCVTCTHQPTFELNPVFYWSLDDVGTTWAIDSSGHGRDAALDEPFDGYPGVTHEDHLTPMWVGTQDRYLHVSPVSGWPRDALSFSVFFRAGRPGRALVSYSWSDGLGFENDNEFMVMLRPIAAGVQDGLYIDVHDVRVAIPRAELDPSTGDWHHLVATWHTEGQVEVYLDGVLAWDGEVLDDDPLSPTFGEILQLEMEDGGALYVGQEQNCHDGCLGSLRAWDGLIDEVAIFDRVLTSDEVDRIFASVTCGEGVGCDRIDADLDGVVDEHLFGSVSCPGVDCLQIEETGSSMGDRWYTVQPDGSPVPVEAYCDMTGGAVTHYCGDGAVFAPYETCDEVSPGCASCAIEVPMAVDCEDVLALGYTADGPYVVDLRGDGGGVRVRCDQTTEGGGWTLVHDHDIRDKQLFACESDALVSNPSDPFASRYSLLAALPSLDRGYGWQLRMTWPEAFAPKVDWWQQTSDPRAEAVVTGYVPCAVEATQHGFAGLYRVADAGLGACCPYPQLDPLTTCPEALIRGGSTVEPWYAVGLMGPLPQLDYVLPATQDLGGDGSTPRVQLWARSAGATACTF